MNNNTSHSSELYLLAGGGTGGHLFPGFSVAAALRQLRPEAEILFLCTPRPFDSAQMPRCGFDYRVQPVRPLPSPTRPGTWLPFFRGWFGSLKLCRQIMTDRKVKAVLGLGGYASGPAIKSAAALGIPTALLNPDAVPGVANRYCARRVDRIFVQWPETLAYFGRFSEKCAVVGCPIRAEFSQPAARAEALGAFNLAPDRKTLVIVGGSQGGRNVNEAAAQCLAELGEPLFQQWQVVHIAGDGDLANTAELYRQARLPVTVLPFVSDMPRLLAATDLVIGRAGASTLAELTALGIPSILLPYPYHKDNHQRLNAEVLAKRQAALIVTDHRDTPKTAPELLAALRHCINPEILTAMSTAAQTLAQPAAATEIARYLADLP